MRSAIETGDDCHLDDAAPGAATSIWSHPHLVLAVAAQAGVFSFCINSMTSETPPISAWWNSVGWISRLLETNTPGVLVTSDRGAATRLRSG